jgi:hypothetical protein
VSHLSRGILAPYPVDAADHPGYMAGQTNPPYLLNPTIANAAAIAAVDTVYLWLWLPKALALATALGIRVGTGGAGSSMKLAVWANNPNTMRPTSTPLVADNTGVATTASNAFAMCAIARTFTPGTPVWIGSKFTGTLPQATQAGAQGDGARLFAGGISSGSSAGNCIIGVSAADAFANNIGNLDLTGASFSLVAQSTGMPAYWMGT